MKISSLISRIIVILWIEMRSATMRSTSSHESNIGIEASLFDINFEPFASDLVLVQVPNGLIRALPICEIHETYPLSSIHLINTHQNTQTQSFLAFSRSEL